MSALSRRLGDLERRRRGVRQRWEPARPIDTDRLETQQEEVVAILREAGVVVDGDDMARNATGHGRVAGETREECSDGDDR